MNPYSLEEGTYLVKLARSTIEKRLGGVGPVPVPDAPEKLKEKAGVFVTLETYPEKDLRGCIGFPEPTFPLVEAICRAAISASVEDPRFPPMMKKELENTLIEVTVLTSPELIEAASPDEYINRIEIGRDGLIIEKGLSRGLLLPQVPVDHKWNREDFLSHACMKAGLTADCWLNQDTKIYKFSGIVFTEKEPGGEIEERPLSPTS